MLVAIWFLIALILRWMVEPYLRIKHDIWHDEVDKLFLTFFWPFGIPVYFVFAAFLLYKISDLDDKADSFWHTKIRNKRHENC